MDPYCLVYLDDIIIWSTSFEDHLERLHLVFERLRSAGLKMKLSKCNFLQQRARFLGHIVSSDGIQVDPEKTKVVKDWPTPSNAKELQSFLDLAGYYRRFVPGFSVIAAPLYHVCKQKTTFRWGREQREAFFKLKELLTTTPVVAYPSFSPKAGVFILDTDASQQHGIGAVLSQVLYNQMEVKG